MYIYVCVCVCALKHASLCTFCTFFIHIIIFCIIIINIIINRALLINFVLISFFFFYFNQVNAQLKPRRFKWIRDPRSQQKAAYIDFVAAEFSFR